MAKHQVSNEIGASYLEVEHREGNLLYLKGHKYPHKGIPTVDSVENANSIKEAIITPWRLKRITVPVERLETFAREIYWLLRNLHIHKHTAYLCAYMLEYDQAYRFRIQDLANETNAELLSKRPIREIWRLHKLNGERDYKEIHRKFTLAAIACTCLVLFKGNVFKTAINKSRWDRIQMDENDRYWAGMKTDYAYFGGRL